MKLTPFALRLCSSSKDMPSSIDGVLASSASVKSHCPKLSAAMSEVLRLSGGCRRGGEFRVAGGGDGTEGGTLATRMVVEELDRMGGTSESCGGLYRSTVVIDALIFLLVVIVGVGSLLSFESLSYSPYCTWYKYDGMPRVQPHETLRVG